MYPSVVKYNLRAVKRFPIYKQNKCHAPNFDVKQFHMGIVHIQYQHWTCDFPIYIFSNIRTIFTTNAFIAPILPTTGNCIGPIYHYYHQCYCNLLSLLYLFYFVYSYYYITGYCYDYSTSIITTNFNATVITKHYQCNRYHQTLPNATVISKNYQCNRYH